MKKQVGIALVTVLGLASSVLAEDITAAVRAANAATFGLTGGTEYNAVPISRAFDGLWAQDGHRAMIAPETGYPPISVYYHISDDFRPGECIVVTAFTLRRSPQYYDSNRTPLRMRLEASPTGDVDGDDWVVLAENHEDFPGGGDDHEPTEDEISFTVEVPRCLQGRSYRHYRFVFPARPTFVNDFHELFLEGTIGSTVSEHLTWNGGASAWDATSERWLDGAGAATAWKPFSVAVIGSPITSVVGTQDVAALRIGEMAEPAVSGGALCFGSPAGIGIRDSVALEADIASLEGEDTATSCVSGTRTTDYTYLPCDMNGDLKSGLEVVYWRNRRLSDITGFAPAFVVYSGDLGWEEAKDRGVKDFINDGQTASAWFWRYYSKGTDIRHAWIAIKVQFRQVGPDITAKIVRGGYVWVEPATPTTGPEIDYEKVLTSSTAYVLDDAGAHGSPYFGIKNLLAQCAPKTGLEIANDWHPELKMAEEEKLPHDPENDKIGEKVLYATNLKLSKVSGFSSAMLWYNAVKEPAEPLRMAREDDALTVQFQRFYMGSNVLCVKVRFTQEGDDVYAQALYAKYLNSQTQLGADFDRSGAQQPIWHAGVNVGYTMSDMVPVVERPVCSFDGAFAIRGPVTADGVDLTFGGAVSVRDAEMFAETPIALTDGASLAVADGVAATMPKLTVSGTVSLTCGEGASLALGEIELADGATVNLVGDLDAGAFRVGTSATLPRSVLKKFSVANKGLRVVQDEDGYLKTALPPGLMLLFR